jgi:hypothetical protein
MTFTVRAPPGLEITGRPRERAAGQRPADDYTAEPPGHDGVAQPPPAMVTLDGKEAAALSPIITNQEIRSCHV